MSPPPVCAQWCTLDGEPQLAPTNRIAEVCGELITDPRVRIWGVNIGYDMRCLMAWTPLAAAIRKAYDEGRILDNGALEKIAAIGKRSTQQRYSMAAMADAYGVPHEDKSSGVRTDYGWLLGRPLADYPAEHTQYALGDAYTGSRLTKRQVARHGVHGYLPDLSRRLLWLGGTSGYGVRTDKAYIDVLGQAAREQVEHLRTIAQTPFPLLEFEEEEIEGTADPYVLDRYRLVKLKTSKRKSGNWEPITNRERVKELVSIAYDGNPPLTDKGAVKTGKAILEQSGDPLLQSFAEYGVWSAVLNKDLPMLQGGAYEPIHTRYGTADTLRTTSSRPNLQNFRSNALKTPQGEIEVRKAVVPREGYCFISADYSGLENCTLAQTCVSLGIGHHLADMLNTGMSLHDVVGAVIHGVTYEQALALNAAKDAAWKHGSRQAAKITNFGAPVGMGAASLKVNAKIAHNVDMTLADAKRYLAAWREANPDGAAFLRYCGRLPTSGGGYSVQIPGTPVIRRGATFCAAANTHFQGLAAALCSAVGWEIYWAQFDPASPLFGCPLVNFVHDEFIVECPIGRQTRAAAELCRIMVDVGQPFVPDLRLSAEPAAMNRWTKDAEAVYSTDGELTIYNAA